VRLSSTLKEIEPSFKGKVSFVYLSLVNEDETTLAKQLKADKPTTIAFIGKDGKVKEVISGLQDKAALELKIKALTR
jgi:hypothetical protein